MDGLVGLDLFLASGKFPGVAPTEQRDIGRAGQERHGMMGLMSLLGLRLSRTSFLGRTTPNEEVRSLRQTSSVYLAGDFLFWEERVR